jgi:hypothetical protein
MKQTIEREAALRLSSRQDGFSITTPVELGISNFMYFCSGDYKICSMNAYYPDE